MTMSHDTGWNRIMKLGHLGDLGYHQLVLCFTL